MNTAESAVLKRLLDGRCWSAADSAEEAELVIINTCSVRETAEQRIKGRLAHFTALKKKIVPRYFSLLVTGCMAARLGNKLHEYGADFVVPPADGQSFLQILARLENGGQHLEAPLLPQETWEDEPAYEEGSFRCFVPIMRGCNNFCSYCIVPYVRGREVSRSPAAILAEIAFLTHKNVCEITLLGQNVNSYHFHDKDGNITFPDLLKQIACAVRGTSIRRVRFLSSHPKDLSPEIISVLKDNPVFCRHIHLCVQHGSNRVLSAMNRRYTRETYLSLVDKLRAALPDLSLSTDILVGFPGETEAEFEEVLTLMDEIKFLYAYMYHYNPREGTAAAALPGRISDTVKHERLARVITLQKKHTQELLRERLGRAEEVLVEGISRNDPDEVLCRTERDEMVVVAANPSLAGSFIQVTIKELRGNTLRGSIHGITG